MLKKYIEKLVAGKNLSREETMQAAVEIFNDVNPYQTSAFLSLMRAKGETPEEILGVVDAMRSSMVKLDLNFPVLDIVGTGGDCVNTINISTGAGILAASCGVKVAKHGNRSVSSKCGSADVLESLGVNIQCSPQRTIECIKKVGFGFCFAPLFHPGLAKLKEVRKRLGIPTLFNILGPLLNPAAAEYLMIGVFNEGLADLLADTINYKLPTTNYIKKALVFHSAGLDELGCISPTTVIEVTPAGKKRYILDSSDYGFKRCKVEDLRGGTPDENANILKSVFDGKRGAVADTLIFNAAVALYVYGKAKSIQYAVGAIKERIKNGEASRTLKNLVAFTREESNA
jgi:anthranilate phosphoribosyltransferase